MSTMYVFFLFYKCLRFVWGVCETLDVAQSDVRVDARVGHDRKCSQSSLSGLFLHSLAERLTKF